MLLAGRHILLVSLLVAGIAAVSMTADAGRSETKILLRMEKKMEQMEVTIAAMQKRIDSLEKYMHFSEKTDIKTIRQEQKEKMGLRVVARPTSEVFINGKYVGDTPYENYRLKVGRYTVRVKHPDYDPIDEVIEIRSREVQTVDISFR